MIDKKWKLSKFNIEWKPGYSFESDPVKQQDRYESYIAFSNNDGESFVLKIDEALTLECLKASIDFIKRASENATDNLMKTLAGMLESTPENIEGPTDETE